MTRAFYTSLADGSFARWVEREVLNRFQVPVAVWRSLPTDASFRSFFRIESGAGTHVAMYAPPELEDTHRFVKMAQLFSENGIGVPELHAFDRDAGFVLMEDMGDDLFEKVYTRESSTRAINLALSALIRIQSIRVSPHLIPAYTQERFQMELGIFCEWFLQALLERSPPNWYTPVSEALVQNALDQPSCCIHRDFHCRNLLIKTSGELGVVDFQDALIGPITYDLASLLGDCYHEFDEDQVASAIHSYRAVARRARLPSIEDDEEFRLCFDLMVIQRQLKAIGIFARLWLQRGRTSHLRDIAPVLARIAGRAQAYPQTLPLADAIESDLLPHAVSRLETILT